jgi:CRP/FNR family cyclic AMP-dependent transcriptional regulator
MAVADLLRGCPLFFELYDHEVERLTRFCRVHSRKPGELILMRGQPLHALYIILQGRARAQTGQGMPWVLGVGDPFGEAYLADDKACPADLFAETDCALLELEYSGIYALFKSEPRVFGLIMLNLSRLLAKRLHQAGGGLGSAKKAA